MFSTLLNLLFPHGFHLPFTSFVVPPGPSSDANLVGQSSVPPAPLTSILGAYHDLNIDEVEFSASVEDATPTSGSFSLFTNPGITAWTSNRASARIVGPFSVSVVARPKDASTTYQSLSGFVAVMPDAPVGFTYPTTVSAISMLPGRARVVLNSGIMSVEPLGLPPTIQSEVNFNQVLGRNPNIVYAFYSTGNLSITVSVSGKLLLSGVSYPTSFFPAAPASTTA